MRLGNPAGGPPVDLTAVDLTDPFLFGDGQPHRVFAALRALDRPHWQPVGDSGFWSAARHVDAMAVLGQARTFTSERGTLVGLLGLEDPAGRGQMAVTDPPRHARLRRPTSRPLRPRALAEHTDRLRRLVRALLAPAVDGERLDFARAMMELSTAVAGIVMGLPESDWPSLTTLATMAIAPDDPDFALPGGRAATLSHAHRELFAYFHDEVADRRRQGADRPDMISVFLSVRMADGEPMPVGAVVANCYSMLMGASVTSPHVPSATLLHLLETGTYAEWAVDPRRLAEGVDEALRWASPANHFMRYATRDVELSGATVRAGDAVVAWIGSANRDERVFAEPFRFSVGRRPNPHLAFGAGPHYCVGHHAARQTLCILFEELGDTFEHVELAGPPAHLCSNFVAGIKGLPVTAVARREARR